MHILKHKKMLFFLRLLPVLLIPAFIFLHLVSGEEISIDRILSYTPNHPLSAAFFFMLLYAVKSMSVLFSILLLQIAVGNIFPPMIAICVNITGMMLCYTVPYWVGRYSGLSTVEKFSNKYAKIAELMKRQHSNHFFVSFF